MKKILLYFFLSSCTTGCNHTTNNQNWHNEISDSLRVKLLEEKKQRFEQSQNSGSTDTTNYKNIEWGDIRFTPYVPPYPELGSTGVALIENKINAMISKNGISGNVGNPSFVIIPAINLVSKNVTTTAPTMFANTYQVTFYTACLTDGTIFSSADFSFKGVGESPLKAFINGIESADLDNSKFNKLLTDGKAKALRYYETHCGNIFNEAKNMGAQKQYAEAILLLKTIPKEVSCYNETGGLIEKYFNSNLAENCSQLLSKMKAELGKQNEVGSFNEKIMTYFALIPADGPCGKDAQIMYKSYIKPKTKDEKEFNLKKEKLEQDHIYAIFKTELESKTAIEGQTSLLDKYKKDYEYEKLRNYSGSKLGNFSKESQIFNPLFSQVSITDRIIAKV